MKTNRNLEKKKKFRERLKLRPDWTAYRRFKFESLIQILPLSLTLNRWFKFKPTVGGSATQLKFIKSGLRSRIRHTNRDYYFMSKRWYFTFFLADSGLGIGLINSGGSSPLSKYSWLDICAFLTCLTPKH